MLKQIIVVAFFSCLVTFANAQVRSTDEIDPGNPDEAFFHANMGIPMNYIFGKHNMDTLVDANGRLLKRSYADDERTFYETWTYYENGALKEYVSFGQDTINRHETYNAAGHITEYYEFTDGKPIHWYYKYTTIKLKKQKILRKEIYNTNNQMLAAHECDITDGNEKLLRIFTYRFDEQGGVKVETIRNMDSAPGEDWYYYYDDGDNDYKALMDPNMDEIRRVYLEK
ncbi:MAG: hypothetical protein IPG07_01555 [Crocinitomicaceae bacterium]|nr:hypothetical protein [Crocinitomicaceae bacterium]